jgi:hypothetical protein
MLHKSNCQRVREVFYRTHGAQTLLYAERVKAELAHVLVIVLVDIMLSYCSVVPTRSKDRWPTYAGTFLLRVEVTSASHTRVRMVRLLVLRMFIQNRSEGWAISDKHNMVCLRQLTSAIPSTISAWHIPHF